ncbi:MAG: Gfo/Idh/MocA family oxidoreductase [Eubacteriales bacterium]|nr:Gfo/Idh/MocA family oxidoreductase [Eubacteriales bacterium]
MKKMKIGIAGAGFISSHHFECMRRVYGVDFEIVGIFDIIREKSLEFAKKRGIKAFDTFEQMLSEVDIVDICTPPFAHAGNIIDAAKAGKHIMCEKPLLGYSPPKEEWEHFNGSKASKEAMLKSIVSELKKIHKAAEENGVLFAYFENFVYTPHVQKEAQIIKKTKAQLLRMMGEEAHKGNHAGYSSYWKYACGGSLISTGSHPMGGIFYLKRVEGETTTGKPIRPVSVTARTHTLTKLKGYRDEGFLRSDYHDVEDYGFAHVVFEDGTVGDIFAGATVLGGINDYIDVYANNHTSRLTINPTTLIETYNPGTREFDGIDINYGISTNDGWLKISPDENWMYGYLAEMQDALESFAAKRQPKSCLQLAIDTTAAIYAAYLSAEKAGQEVSIERIGG